LRDIIKKINLIKNKNKNKNKINNNEINEDQI
jgi:hypothetical protein